MVPKERAVRSCVVRAMAAEKEKKTDANRNTYVICNGDVGKLKIFLAYKYVCLHRGGPVVNVRNKVQNR